MKNYLKGGIIGIAIWILLFLIFQFSGLFIDCPIPVNGSGEFLEGIECRNPFQSFVLTTLSILSFPFIFLGANPNLSSVGPQKVFLFWIGSAISLTLWGMLIGLIAGKIKSKNQT